MKKFIGVLLVMLAFLGNAILFFGALIIGIDLLDRKKYDNKNKDNKS